jgi:hypothetical protein
MTTIGASRTATPHDIADTEIEFLRDLALEAKDPELRAKLGYLVWLRMRDHQWLERAPRLAVLLRNQELNGQVFLVEIKWWDMPLSASDSRAQHQTHLQESREGAVKSSLVYFLGVQGPFPLAHYPSKC